MPSTSVRALLILNPRSGRGKTDLTAPLHILRSCGWDVDIQPTRHGKHARELARQAVEASYDVVIGCGGDGTLNDIVAGLAGSPLPLGFLPVGTVNLWARELGISLHLPTAARQLVDAQPRRMDVGRLTINNRRTRYFLLMAGLGIDGAVMGSVSKTLKKRIGPLAVALAAFKAFPTFRPMAIRADLDGLIWQGRVSLVIIGNTRQYGGFTRITPSAYVDDGLLDVCLITASGVLSIFRQLASLLLRQRPDPATATIHRVATLTIQTPVPLPLQVDGSAVRRKKKDSGPNGTTYCITTIPQGLTVLVPPTYSGALFQHPAPAKSHTYPAQNGATPPRLGSTVLHP